MLTTQVAAKSVTINSGKVSLSGVYFASSKSFAPAVLLLHGCHRLSNQQKPSSERTLKMASLLQEMGFGVLLLDVDGPKGRRKGCLGRANKKISACGPTMLRFPSLGLRHEMKWMQAELLLLAGLKALRQFYRS